MSNTLFKKVTASVAALSVVLSIVSPVTGVKAADDSVEAANRLASLGVIVDSSSNPNAYNLGSSITRREMLKVMMNLSSVEVTDTCEGKFSDLPKTDWGCKYAEAALNAGFIAANPKFRPNDLVTEAEALKMIMQARGVAKKEGVADWSEAYRQAAVEAGIVAEGTKLSTTTSAKRSMVFVSADSAVTSTTSDETTTDDSDVNLDDLFGDLFDEDGTDATTDETTDEDMTSDEETTDEEVTSNVKAGDLEVSLSAETPAASDIPDSVNGVEVAKFDFTAWDEDISVTSLKLKRVGLGSASAVEDVAVFGNGSRLSKTKTFNSSDDYAEITLSPALVVKAWETETVTVKVNTEATAGNFAVELVSVGSSAANVEGAPVTWETFQVKAVDTSSITISTDGTSSNPKLGADQSEILKFKVKNNWQENETVTVSEVTLREGGTIDEEDELENVSLYYNGSSVASTAKMNGKYVTFELASPIEIKESNTAKFVVKADIVGGAGDTVEFYLDNVLDISATASKNGYVTVSSSLAQTDTSAVTVQAWEVTLIDVDAETTKIREDKDDVVLGKVKITTAAGKNLELDQFWVKLTLVETSGNPAANNLVGDILSNIELYDETTGTTYDLAVTGTDNSLTEAYWDTDMGIALPSGTTTTFAIRADTATTITGFDGLTITPSITVGSFGANGWLYIKETEDDSQVTDITPSALSFKTINGSESSATVTVLNLSSTKNAVVGSKDVEALSFEVKADESSKLTLDEVVVDGQAGSAFDSSLVSELKLYKGSVSDANLLDKVSGSQISSEKATFDGFDVEIAANAKQTFIVTVSLVDDSTNNGDTINLAIDSDGTNLEVSMEDVDGDDVVYADATDEASTRTITVKGAGSLKVVVDTTDSQVDKTKNILWGTTSSFVASYELTAVNEDVLVKDFTITSALANLQYYVSEVVVYANDKTTEIARETVTSSTVEFENEDFVVAEWTSNVYIKVVTSKIGKDQAWRQSADITLDLVIDDAEGNSSNKVLSDWNNDWTVDAQEVVYDDDADASYDEAANDTDSGESLAFKVLPTKVSSVTFVDSISGTSRASKLNNGENNVAIIAVTTDSSSNVNTNGGTLKTILKQVKLNQSRYSDTQITGYTIEKVNGTESAVSGANAAWTYVFTPTVADSTNYTVIVDGTSYTVTSDADATAQEIVELLQAAVNAHADVTATEDNATLTVTVDASKFATAIPGTSNLSVVNSSSTNVVTFDTSTFTTDDLIDNGVTVYYVVKANVTKDSDSDNDDYVKVSFDTLNNSEIVYSADDAITGLANVTDLRIGQTKIDGTQINE